MSNKLRIALVFCFGLFVGVTGYYHFHHAHKKLKKDGGAARIYLSSKNYDPVKGSEAMRSPIFKSLAQRAKECFSYMSDAEQSTLLGFQSQVSEKVKAKEASRPFVVVYEKIEKKDKPLFDVIVKFRSCLKKDIGQLGQKEEVLLVLKSLPIKFFVSTFYGVNLVLK